MISGELENAKFGDSDIDEIMRYSERVASPGLADEFCTELLYFMTKAAEFFFDPGAGEEEKEA
ncbi:MAG TPA: hypothetical protein VE860_13125 [Chthoniobacterales bacterium]|nr:hypothetical protein [Chthoniobacterales bacterium]